MPDVHKIIQFTLPALRLVRAADFISEGGQRRFGKRTLQSLEKVQVQSIVEIFRGECSTEEVDRAAAVLRGEDAPVDCLIAGREGSVTLLLGG